MELNEIKKVLYKEKPIAVRYGESLFFKTYLYTTQSSLGKIKFSVPISDMGEKLFEEKIPAQLLIRWIEQ